MDTSNKIRVVDQDALRMKGTDSGGVREPADPKHYPTFGGSEGAVGTSNSQSLSTLGSFKDILVARPDIPKVQVGTEGVSPAASPIELQRPSLRTANRTGASAIVSPKILASRCVQVHEPVQGGVGGAGEVYSSTTPCQQVSYVCDAPVISSADLHALVHSKGRNLDLAVVL